MNNILCHIDLLDLKAVLQPPDFTRHICINLLGTFIHDLQVDQTSGRDSRMEDLPSSDSDVPNLNGLDFLSLGVQRQTYYHKGKIKSTN